MTTTILAFDAPRLAGIAVDGSPGDWGDRGLFIERLALHDGSTAKAAPAPDGAGTLRLGWDEGGLLLLLTLPKSRLEGATGTVCTVNLIVRDGARPLNWWQAMLDLPPRKTNETAVSPAVRFIEHRHDQWVDPRDARQALAALAPAKQSQTDRTSASWLPSAYVASLWRILNTRPSGSLGVADILSAVDAR